MFKRLPKKQSETKPSFNESPKKALIFVPSNSSQKQTMKGNLVKLKTSDLPQFAENRAWKNYPTENLNESPTKAEKQRALLYQNFSKNQIPSMFLSAKSPKTNWNFDERELLEILNVIKPNIKTLANKLRTSLNSLKATGAIPFKKIQKPFSSKKLTAYWLKKTVQTPVLFRKVRADFQRNMLVEHHDLIKASAKYRFKE